MIEHLIFDFDGTLADSYPMFVDFFHIIAKKHGLELPYDDTEANRLLKITLFSAYEKLRWDEKLPYKDFLLEFRALQEKHALDFIAFPEARELLEYSMAHGKKNYLYTHTGSVVHEMLKNMGIDRFFTFVLDDSYGFPAKPKPDALLFLLAKFHLDPKTCMMIGDRPIDAYAGMNAGMTGCLWDADGLFPDATVDHKVIRLSEIKNLI